MLNGFKVITLCGSTKYADVFKFVQQKMTLKGNIVLSPCVFSHSDNIHIDNDTNELLLNIQKTKIEISDCIIVINVDNYIGENTKKEIEFAQSLNKEIIYLI